MSFPHSFFGSLYLSSGMSLERVQTEPGLLGSEKINLDERRRQNAAFCLTELLRELLCHFALNLLWHLSSIIYMDSRKTCVS